MFQPNQLTPEQPWFSHVLVFLKWLSPRRFWRWFLSLSRLLRTFSCTFSQWPVGDFLCGYLLWVCILHVLWYNRTHFKTALTAVNSKKPNHQNFVTVRALTVSTENKYCFHARYCTSVICQFHPGEQGLGTLGAQLSKSWPYFTPKNVTFQTRLQISKRSFNTRHFPNRHKTIPFGVAHAHMTYI